MATDPKKEKQDEVKDEQLNEASGGISREIFNQDDNVDETPSDPRGTMRA